MELSRSEQAAVYAALVPEFRADRNRYSTAYRGGDSQDALSVDLERGWYDHAIGEGGDCVAFAMRALQCDFRAAVRWISDLVGRDLLTDKPQQPKYSELELCRAELFAIGLRWRLSRAIEIVTAELFGPRHEPAAAALPTLTRWRERVAAWHELRLNGHPKDPSSFWERCITWRGQHEALELLPQLSPALVGDCIAEANEAYELLARAIGGQAQEAAA